MHLPRTKTHTDHIIERYYKVPMSPDFNVGDLVILQHSVFHPEHNGALAEIVAPEQSRGSATPSGCPRPRQRLYRARVIAPVDGEVAFAVARYQLRPLPGVDTGVG